MSRWFRHYAGMARDDKLVRVSIKSKQTIERVVWVWTAILESAAEIDDGGRYEIDHAEMARFLRCPEGKLAAVEDALRDLGRLHEGAVARWGDRQFQSDRSAARTKRYRDGQKVQNGPAQETSRDADVTSQQRHGDAPETETETETETEVVEDKPLPQPRKRDAFPMPEHVDPEAWRDFLVNRQRKRQPNTPTAHKRLLADLARLSNDEWPPGRLIEHAAAAGWAGIYDPNEGQRNGKRSDHDPEVEHPGGRTGAAADRVFGRMGGDRPM